ncbi:MAG: hypothetical protein KDB14_21115, partial [Planctomycetales bacterium]|nr:hypothetical protein [Planctomycetales bacterium]
MLRNLVSEGKASQTVQRERRSSALGQQRVGVVREPFDTSSIQGDTAMVNVESALVASYAGPLASMSLPFQEYGAASARPASRHFTTSICLKLIRTCGR